MEYKVFGRQYRISEPWLLNCVAILVAITGLITISSTLEALVHLRRSEIVNADAHTTLLAGLSLIYLASLLKRGKHTAWLVSLPIFIFLAVRNIRHFGYDLAGMEDYDFGYFLNLLLPALVLAILLVGRRFFNVRSEVRSFANASKRAVFILLIAFLYGLIGFQLLDKHDFHQEITWQSGAHYTIDQFGLTTNKKLSSYTVRAHLFLGSLAAISLGAAFYVAISLFSPIRFSLTSHDRDFENVKKLLENYPSNSEDFFKLWPKDKAYFFSSKHQAAIAYRAAGGVALAVGDPVGDRSEFEKLIQDFREFCRLNDWRPAFIHTLGANLKLYEDHGLEFQKIGEEAVIDLKKFITDIAPGKDFRHIRNKFSKQGYVCEHHEPPHSAETIQELKSISDDWLQSPGRGERGFMMGYFSEAYIQQCNVMIVRDETGTAKAFINQIPSFDKEEANYDFLRHSYQALGNINDFLMLNFIEYLTSQGFRKLNMGLCPLSGIKDGAEGNYDMLDHVLHLVYENSSRFYSFKGLRRFKEKYQPEWRDRYIVYNGGLVGLTKTANALVRAMRLPKKY